MKKTCKIITTVFLGRSIREETAICGQPKGFFNHSQNFPTPESVIDLLKLIISLDESTDPGCPTDLVIVNNNVDHYMGNRFLNSIDGKKIHSGTIKILHRENYGRSFGGYNYAFEIFRDKYKYFIFTEDDILINGQEYTKKAIDVYNSADNVGAVAFQSTSFEGWKGIAGEEFLHIHGGVLLSSNKVLNELYNKLGCLPHCKKNESQKYGDIITKGEIAFANEIHQLGYDLINIEEKLYEYAYDYMRNIKTGRFL